ARLHRTGKASGCPARHRRGTARRPGDGRRVLRGAHRLRRLQRRHGDRRGGDLRAGDGRVVVPHRRRGGGARQRHGVRPRRRDLHPGHFPGAPGGGPPPGRDHLDQHLQHHADRDAVRRLQAIGDRAGELPRRRRALHADQGGVRGDRRRGGALLMEAFDYVIVGGGSALANRLSADPSNRVLVLEAGRMDWRWDVFIHMPAALSFPIGSRFYDWRYESDPEPHMHGRRIYHARGKVLGGSSSINGMIFQRGNPMDYEKWAAEPGMETWDYAHCLPYFKKMEKCLAGGDDFRGTEGPLVLERGPAANPLFQAFFEAVQQAGYRLTDDVNGYRQEGFAPFDRNVHRGRRLSAARAYLHPVLHRPNLTVRTRAFVTRIRMQGLRAVGVDYTIGGRAESVAAGEVILCGGAFNSPHLLQLSG